MTFELSKISYTGKQTVIRVAGLKKNLNSSLCLNKLFSHFASLRALNECFRL